MKVFKITSLIIAVIMLLLVLGVFSANADDDDFAWYDGYGEADLSPYEDVWGEWGAPISYEELQPGDVVIYRDGDYIGVYAGQDENGNDLIIHDSNEADGVNLYHENPSAYVRIIYDGYDYITIIGDNVYYGRPGVGRTGSLSVAAEESGQNAATAVDVTEASEESPTSPTVNQSLTSPKTGGVSCASTVIFTLIISAVIGTGIFICGLSKKIGS